MATLNQFKSRKDWLEARKGGIGGSDAAAILGVDPYRSALEVYCDKIGIAEPKEDNDATKWGRKLEPLVAEAYQEETGRELKDHGFNIWQGSEPFLIASQDREIVKPQTGHLEIKTSNYIKEGDLAEEIPIPWQVQYQHSLAATGLEWGGFAILLNARKLFWVDVERDNSFIEAMLEAEAKFWKRIQDHDPPPPDASESATKILKKLYPKDTGKTVVLPSDALEWDRIRGEADQEIKRWTAQKTAAENNLKAAISDATFGTFNNVTYSWRYQKREGYVVSPTEFRVLKRVKEK